MALTLKRDFLASDKSIVTGATPEEAAGFAAKANAIQADICIVDENLDYDVAGASMVGTKIVEGLRSMGYAGVIVLYSANEKLELSLNWGLVDGFASKSSNRLDTKRLLTNIYFESLQRKQGEFIKRKNPPVTNGAGSTTSADEYSTQAAPEPGLTRKANVSLSHPHRYEGYHPYRIFVSSDVSVQSKALPQPKDLSTFTAGYYIALIPAHAQSALAIRAVDPNVSIMGIFPQNRDFSPDGVVYSPFVRFTAGLPAVDFKLDVEILNLFASGFDALAKHNDVDAFDPAILSDLVRKRILTPNRFFGTQPLNQDMDTIVLDDFETLEERNSMIEVMDQAVTESLHRIYKRPTLDNVRKVAHLIKGASVQIGARALHKLAVKTEKYCEADFDGPQKEVQKVFAEFFLLLLDFLLVSKTYCK
jgi:hypothetical protein